MRLACAMIFVRDFPRMRDFYQQMFATQPVNTEFAETWALFETGGARFALHAIPAEIARNIEIASPPKPRESSPVKFIFEVDNVPQERSRLEAMGITLLQRPWQDPAKEFEGLDPEGNIFQVSSGSSRAKLRNSTTVFLVGNIEPTMEWYKQLGFESQYFPPGFAILRRDDIEIFLQQQPGYVAPTDPGREARDAWNLYVVTNNVRALYAEFSALRGVEISRELCPQEYGMLEFDVIDLNGHRLVFAQPDHRAVEPLPG